MGEFTGTLVRDQYGTPHINKKHKDLLNTSMNLLENTYNQAMQKYVNKIDGVNMEVQNAITKNPLDLKKAYVTNGYNSTARISSTLLGAVQNHPNHQHLVEVYEITIKKVGTFKRVGTEAIQKLSDKELKEIKEKKLILEQLLADPLVNN